MAHNPVDWAALADALISSSARQGDAADAGAELVHVCAAAFAAGFARGHWGRVEVGGVPVDLGAGVVLHLLASSGLAGRATRDLERLAEGALATYFATWGASAGKRVSRGEALLPALNPLPPATRHHGAGERSNGVLSRRDSELLEFIRTVVPNSPPAEAKARS